MITDIRLQPIAEWTPDVPLFCKCCKQLVGQRLEQGRIAHGDALHAENCVDAAHDFVELVEA